MLLLRLFRLIVLQRVMVFVANNVNCRWCSWTIIDFCTLCNITEDLLAFLVCRDIVLGEMQRLQYFFG